MHNNSYNLSCIGLSQDYSMNEQGIIYNAKTKKELKIQQQYQLKDACGNRVRISAKTIYRALFDKEYCIDEIEDLQGEKWKEIRRTSGKYFVSNLGRIKSYCGYKAYVLKANDNGKGYKFVWINGKKKYIHILVATEFIEKTNSIENTVDHIDARKDNNSSNNLQWLTQGDNVRKHFNKPLLDKAE